MTTLSHAARMDAIYRYQRHIYDLTRRYYLLGRDELIAALDPPDGGSVLEIGCGNGRNLIVAARRFPHAKFYGVDISTEMLQTAKRAIHKAGLDGRITVGAGDATRFDPAPLCGVARFDRVYISYSLSMIPEWRRALDHGLSLLAEDGRFHAVDFGQCEALPQWFRRMLFAWLSRFDVSPRADMGPVMRKAAASHNMRVDLAPLYRGYAWSARIAA